MQAEDTGHVLLVQRLPDKHDEGEAYARWEAPGGRLDETDPSVWAGAVREWTEETGANPSCLSDPVGGWVSDDGDYEGFVVRVPREADVDIHVQPEEVSRAAWWDPQELDDPRVRDKLTEQLGDVQPILEGGEGSGLDTGADVRRGASDRSASKGTGPQWGDFHRHTDAILAHHAPFIAQGLTNALQGDTVTHLIRAAYQATKQMPGQPTAPGSLNKPNYDQQVASLIAAMPAPPPAATQGLRGALTRLYGDAVLQGANEAHAAMGQPLAPLPVPPTYWEQWEPGHDEAAGQAAPETLAELLHKAHVTIKGITDTQLSRIGAAIADAVKGGVPIEETIARVNDVVNDKDRAALIAETEFARASTAARRATYRRNHIAKVAWLHQPGACPRCLANAAVSPRPINDAWPEGDVPVHPLCRCVEAPYIG